MRVRWLRTALANWDAEIEYIGQDDPAAATRVAQRISDILVQFAVYPAMGRPGRVFGTRELVITGTPYIIPYRVRGDDIQILRVFHGARKWPALI